MSPYLFEVAYNADGWAALLKNPQNRIEAVRPAIEQLGGRVIGAWYAFGDADIVLVAEMPDNVSAAALSLAFAAGGVLRSTRTTVLIPPEDAVQAMRKAAASSYKPQR